MLLFSVFFNDTSTTEIYTYLHTLSLHDALPISVLQPLCCRPLAFGRLAISAARLGSHCCCALMTTSRGMLAVRSATRSALSFAPPPMRSEEHTSELQSLMRTSYAVLCLKKKKTE